MAIPINTTTIAAGGSTYPVYEVPGLPGKINRFLMRTGASRFGSGQFLMRRADWNAINGQSTATLQMTGAPGPGLTLTVLPVMAEPIITGITSSSPDNDIVKVTFYDVRAKNTNSLTRAYNATKDGFPPASSGPGFDCYTSTTNGGTLWTWDGLIKDASAFLAAQIPDDTPSWTPYNVIWDGIPLCRVQDDIAARLFYVIAFDHQASSASNNYGLELQAPGDTLDANDSLTAAADQYFTGGGVADRNKKRLPGKLIVAFQAYNADDPVTDPFAKRKYQSPQVIPGGSSDQQITLHIGETVAVWSSGAWDNQDDMDAIASDMINRVAQWIEQDFLRQELPGIWPFRPDGSTRQVEWISDLQGARTILSNDNGYDWKCTDGLSDPMSLNANQEVVGVGLTNTNIGQNGTKLVWGGSGSGGNQLYRISDIGDADGYYFGYLQKRNTEPFDETSELVLSDYYVDTGAKLVILNIAESKDHNHYLPKGGHYWVSGWPTGKTTTDTDGTTYQVVECDVTENYVGTYDCRTDFLQLDTNGGVSTGATPIYNTEIKALMFRNEHFFLSLKPSSDTSWQEIMTVDWGGILVIGDGTLSPVMTASPYPHKTAIQFSGVSSVGAGETSYPVGFLINNATAHTNAGGDSSCYLDYATGVVTATVVIPQLATMQCGASTPYYFTTPTLFFGPGIKGSGATSGDPLKLFIQGLNEPSTPKFINVYNPGSGVTGGDDCSVALTICAQQVSVATGTESASEGDTDSWPTGWTATLNSDCTINLVANAWTKLSFTKYWVLNEC